MSRQRAPMSSLRTLWTRSIIIQKPILCPQCRHRLFTHSINVSGSKKGKSASSNRYLARQSSDPYVRSLSDPRKATSLRLPGHNRDGITTTSESTSQFISRSAFKLWHLEEKHRFLVPKKRPSNERVVLDLGAAPGGWTQMAWHVIKNKNSLRTERQSQLTKLISLDLLPLHHNVASRDDVDFIQGDFLSPDVWKQLAGKISQWRADVAAPASPSSPSARADVILSDMMANTTDSQTRTTALSYDLLVNLYTFSLSHLATTPESCLVLKIFQSAQADRFRAKYLQGPHGAFQHVKTEKVESSRAESREVYWVCKGFKGGLQVAEEDM